MTMRRWSCPSLVGLARRSCVMLAWLLLPALAICCAAAPAAADNTADAFIPAPGQPWPSWFSGTDCSITWNANTAQNKYHWIKHVVVKIGGETAFDVIYPDPDFLPYNTSVTGTIIFDSTHFGDGSNLNVHLEATDNLGNIGTADNSAPVYNKAYVFGNQSNAYDPDGIGTLINGKHAANTAEAWLAQAQQSVFPTDEADRVQQLRTAILSSLPYYTVFYADSHGDATPYVGDSSFDPAEPDRLGTSAVTGPDVQLTLTDATNGKSAKNLPPYNLVFSDACSVGANEWMATDFGITSMSIDRAFLGWPGEELDNSFNVDWTFRVLDNLYNGQELQDAIFNADYPTGDPSDDERAEESFDPATGTYIRLDPTIYGDPMYKLHGVYGVPDSVIWYQIP